MKTKGSLDDEGKPYSRELIVTIEEIENTKQEKEILRGLKRLYVEVTGQTTFE